MGFQAFACVQQMPVSAWKMPPEAFSILVLFFALMVFSSVIGQVTASMMSLQGLQGHAKKQFWLLRRLLKTRQVPAESRGRILRFLEQRVTRERKRVQQKDVRILPLLSEPLKNLLAWELHQRLLTRHQLFYILQQCIEPMMMRLTRDAVSESAMADQDVLFCLGENASCMTFVHSGTFLYERGRGAECGPQAVADRAQCLPVVGGGLLVDRLASPRNAHDNECG
ncbi:unnamed protein product [Effrenium voratum]|nr:unnamed protein product [Effrenium voratum]